MNSSGINVSASRFAALKIENDDDFIEVKSKSNKNQKQQNNQKNSSHQAQNRNAQNQQQTNGGNKKKHKKKHHSNKNSNSNNENKDEDLNEWIAHDQEQLDEDYKNQLRTALIESKVQYEMDQSKTVETNGNSQPYTITTSKNDNSSQSRIQKKSINERELFEDIDKNVEKLVEKERVITSGLLNENVYDSNKYILLKLQDEVEIYKKQNEDLIRENVSLKLEAQEVKKRNKQLAFILAQGEMKEKSELLMQIDELTIFRDDLAQKVAELTVELEQERSKVQKFESDFKKPKAKH